MKPIAWYDPTNGMVSTDKDSPLFTPLGQVWPLYPKQEDDGVTLPTIRHPRGKPALGDLNPESLETMEIDVPEPVAWIWEKEDGYTSIETHSLDDADMKNVGVKSMKPLYTTPPQRIWVSPTDKEIEAIWKVAMFTDYGIGAELSNQPFVHYARAIEAKLKEKNSDHRN